VSHHSNLVAQVKLGRVMTVIFLRAQRHDIGQIERSTFGRAKYGIAEFKKN